MDPGQLVEIVRREAEAAVETALKVHDEALAMNREHGFPIFDPDCMSRAFIGALEAQDPPFTVSRVDLRVAAQEWAELCNDYDLNERGQAVMARLRAALEGDTSER